METEAYCGEEDPACHASRGKTKRTAPMYEKPGTIYVYLIYGMYHCLNIVTERKEFPAAVLIRGCEPIDIRPRNAGPMPSLHSLSGPGRLCQELRITTRFNNTDLIHNKSLWIADDRTRIPKRNIRQTPRIGVDYAGEAARWPWRFVA